MALHTGDDDVCRMATVMTNGRQFKRPLVSSVPLEIDRNDVFLATKTGPAMLRSETEKLEKLEFCIFG